MMLCCCISANLSLYGYEHIWNYTHKVLCAMGMEYLVILVVLCWHATMLFVTLHQCQVLYRGSYSGLRYQNPIFELNTIASPKSRHGYGTDS